MITDTKQVWGEGLYFEPAYRGLHQTEGGIVLPSKLLARRWRDCNPHTSPPLTQPEEDEDEWRSQTLELLSAAHSLGGVIDLTFDVVESKNAVWYVKNMVTSSLTFVTYHRTSPLNWEVTSSNGDGRPTI